MRDEPADVQVTESCGCVFCDLGLKPVDNYNGRLIHMHRDQHPGFSYCTQPVPAPIPMRVKGDAT